MEVPVLSGSACRRSCGGIDSASDPIPLNRWRQDRHILLIDYILTTGAAPRAAALALKRAGAASVWAATLARARRAHPVAHNTSSAPSDTQDGTWVEESQSSPSARVDSSVSQPSS